METLTNFMFMDKARNGSFKETLLFTITFALMGYLNKFIVDYLENHFNWSEVWSFKFFKTKNILTLEGSMSSSVTSCGVLYYTYQFSQRLEGLFFFIQGQQDKLKIYGLHEVRTDETLGRHERKNRANFIITQSKPFLLCDKQEIYCRIRKGQKNVAASDTRGDMSGSGSIVDMYYIDVFSYKVKLSAIQTFLDEKKQEYLNHLTAIENASKTKFIYNLLSEGSKNKNDEYSVSCFVSSRSFDNMYFNNRDLILSKVDFFLKNKDWYFKNGVPYTLGICLHGVPGTGKTSFIKALANYTKRHILVVSLKLITTRRSLEEIFYREMYTNTAGTVKFEDKIIVFEDIDCLGDIVWERSKKQEEKPESKPKKDLQTMTTAELKESFKTNPRDFLDDPLTLDDILNVMDGVREASGRIMVLTTNHYDKLDAALKRPGRIDINVELGCASRETIGKIYKHYFGQDMEAKELNKINTNFYTPAEVTNIFLSEDHDPQKFIKRLQKNVKVI